MSARIALLLPKLSAYGGVERFGLDVASALTARGHEVHFLCARQDADAPPGVHVTCVGRPGPFKAVKMAWFALAAERARKAGRFDLSIGLGKTLKQDMLRIGGGPLTNFWALSKLAYAPGVPRAWKMLRRRLSLANMLTRYIEPRQLRNARMVVAVSHLVRDWLLAAHPWLDPARIRLVYNRPDTDRFHPPAPEARQTARRNLGLEQGHMAVLTAGTNFRLKNVAGCVRALALLPPEFILLVAGGPQCRSLGALGARPGRGRAGAFPGPDHGHARPVRSRRRVRPAHVLRRLLQRGARSPGLRRAHGVQQR